jgi:ribosome-binding factor A
MIFTRGTLREVPCLDKQSAPFYARRHMSSENKRAIRVAESLREGIAELLVEGVRDPRVGFTTVTEVRLSPDLRQAKVFVSVYGNPEERQRTLAALAAAQGFLRRELGPRLRLRYTPELTFLADETLDRAERVSELLAAVSAGQTEAPEHAEPFALPVKTARSEMLDSARVLEQARREAPPKPQRRRSRQRRRR